MKKVEKKIRNKIFRIRKYREMNEKFQKWPQSNFSLKIFTKNVHFQNP